MADASLAWAVNALAKPRLRAPDSYSANPPARADTGTRAIAAAAARARADVWNESMDILLGDRSGGQEDPRLRRAPRERGEAHEAPHLADQPAGLPQRPVVLP